MQNIILIGFMGTGKTTIGNILAAKLGRTFIDIDRKIEVECGMKITDIFKHQGEQGFRRRESLIIQELIEEKNLVIATGGGAILVDQNVRDLKKIGALVCLNASVEEILQRVGEDKNRPLLNTANRQQAVSQLLESRRVRYQLADYQVDTSHLTPFEVAEKIIELLTKEIPG